MNELRNTFPSLQDIERCLIATTRDGQRFYINYLEDLIDPSGWAILQQVDCSELDDFPPALVRISEIVSVTFASSEKEMISYSDEQRAYDVFKRFREVLKK